MEKVIEGEILIVGSQYLANGVLITNKGKRDINLADKLKDFNGKKVKITVEVIGDGDLDNKKV
jgi:hypothetical protein